MLSVELVYELQKQLEEIPEASWKESQTIDFVKKQIKEDPVWSENHAVIYEIGKGTPIFFRAELDALNTSKGIKHVCGHSAHLAALISAYLYFRRFPPTDKKIYFIFQPSEEGYPSGAKYIAEHWKDMKSCAAGFAFHVWPSKKKSQLFNAVMAAGDYFEIDIEGKGTHIQNKYTWPNSDVLAVAGAIVSSINKYTTQEGFLMHVGTIHGGEAPNALAASAKLAGDIRFFTKEGQKAALKQLLDILHTVHTETKGVGERLTHYSVTPLVRNDKELLTKLKKFLSITDADPSFATEDFSFYPVPTVMLHIGTGSNVGLHQTNFIVPQEVTVAIFNNLVTIGEKISI